VRLHPPGRSLPLWGVAVAAVAVAVACTGVACTGPVAASGRSVGTASPVRTRATPSDWTVYHGEPDGSGAPSRAPNLRSPTRAWQSPTLDGAVYGEPLEAAGRVIVATERDTVYALAAASGRVAWSTHVGDPVPADELPCGNVVPTVGITGTPLVDLARSEVFVVADELVHGRPTHRLVGLDLYTGKVLADRRVDPPGSTPAALLQRTGLALDRGHVVFGFGGNYGDCGRYHGWVVSVPASARGRIRRDEIAARPKDRQGAVWMGGAAPEVGARGSIWVATGNSAATTGAYDGSDSVVELRPTLHRVGVFAPAGWAADNAGDRDLGSSAPALLADGEVLQVGKSSTAYLLGGSHLGGVGGQRASRAVCDGTVADGGDAVRGHTVYVACRAGVEALVVGRDAVERKWDAARTVTTGGRTSNVPDDPPIVAGGLVWSVGGTVLYGLDAATGAATVRLPIGTNANDFATPSLGDGLLLVTGGRHGDAVLAFAGPHGLPKPPAPAPPAPGGARHRAPRRGPRQHVGHTQRQWQHIPTGAGHRDRQRMIVEEYSEGRVVLGGAAPDQAGVAGQEIRR